MSLLIDMFLKQRNKTHFHITMADDFPWFIKKIPRLTFDIKSYINSKNLYLLYISNSFIYFLIHDNLKKKI